MAEKSNKNAPPLLRLHLPSGRVVMFDPPTTCIEPATDERQMGALNWPLCALGIDMHVGCLPEDVRRLLPPDTKRLVKR